MQNNDVLRVSDEVLKLYGVDKETFLNQMKERV